MEARLETLNIAVEDGDQLAAALARAGRPHARRALRARLGRQPGAGSHARARGGGLGCVCLTFDLRGHAAYGCSARPSRARKTCGTCWPRTTFWSRGGVDPAAIAVVGSSYGGYLAAILTSLRPVRWLALRAPAIYKDAAWDFPSAELHADPHLMAYRAASCRPADNRALRACGAFSRGRPDRRVRA